MSQHARVEPAPEIEEARSRDLALLAADLRQPGRVNLAAGNAHPPNQALHADLTLTGMYNVLEKLRAGEPLNAKEKAIHEQGLVTVLRELHDELNRAVLDAYGWPHDLGDEEILERLLALNLERAGRE